MKAFGVRLAAGAVTILLGAIMAAQAQKDQQDNTESAWSGNQMVTGKTVAPIGLLAELTEDRSPSSRLSSADPRDVQTLKPVGESGWDEPLIPGAVQLVQHTDSTASLALPSEIAQPSDLTQPSDLEQPPAESAMNAQAGGRSVMKMRLPSFNFDPETGADATNPDVGVADESESQQLSAGPSFTMGVPDAADLNDSQAGNTASRAALAQPKLSNFTFADTPSVANPPNANSAPTASPARSAADQAPANDLRMGFPAPMPGMGEAEFADQELPLGTDIQEGATYDQVEFSGGPMLTDSVNPNTGVPAAMLTPISPGEGAPTFAASQPPSLGHAMPMAAMPMAAMPMANSESLRYSAVNQPLQSQQQSLPSSLPSLPAASFDALPMSPPNAFVQPQQSPAGNLVGGTNLPGASFPNGSNSMVGGTNLAGGIPQGGPIYQGVGYKQLETDRPLPGPLSENPTMASPGERFLDGPQSPSVVIHKRAPAEVKVGKPASFVITVKNVGGSKALDVQVHDRVPTGMILTDATPRPNPKYQPELFWELGDLEPNQERTITLQLTAEQEGELGSVARVTFQAAASVRTISTRPELKVVQKAPEKVLIGQQLEIELEVSNPGSGEATGVILQEDVPAGLEHPQGKQIDNLIGTLGPGEIRRQILRMRAVSAGIVQNQIRVKGDDGLETMHTVAVEVIAPDLRASLTGPSRRFLERQATYQLEIANVGTADATNVELSVQLDRGFTFVKTDFEGQYDSARHAVFWSLPALTVGQAGKVPLTLLPVEEGERVLRTEASADLGIRTLAESKVEVASLAELTFSINDSADPIEVGGETVYEIRVSNSGSRDDTNVKVALQLPPGLQLVEQGDFAPQGQGIIAFSPRSLLKANDQMIFKVKAQGVVPGTHLVKAIVTSDQSQVPVTKEESIMVYADQ